jgi:hypothetical protein
MKEALEVAIDETKIEDEQVNWMSWTCWWAA